MRLWMVSNRSVMTTGAKLVGGTSLSAAARGASVFLRSSAYETPRRMARTATTPPAATRRAESALLIGVLLVGEGKCDKPLRGARPENHSQVRMIVTTRREQSRRIVFFSGRKDPK